MDQARILPAQIRAARALVDMTQAQLAQASGLGTTIIKAFEAGRRRLRPSTLASLQRALEVRGVAFIAQDGGGPGVRLRDPITQPVSGESLLAA